MKLTYLKHNEIDKNKWDKGIANSINRNIYAMSWYLDIVSPGWEAIIEGDYEGLFPLTVKKKFKITYLAQPFFAQQLGIFSSKLLTENYVNSFLNIIDNKFKLIDINLNILNKTSNPKFTINKLLTYQLDLLNEYNNIKKKYSKNLTRNIKKALNADFFIEINNNLINPIIELFKKNKGKSLKTNKEIYEILLKLTSSALQKKQLLIYTAYNSNNKSICAGILFLKSFDTFVYLFSASDDFSKKNGITHFLIDKFIESHAGLPYTLDFEGSMIPSLARFYESFGALPVSYLHIHQNNLPFFLKLIKK